MRTVFVNPARPRKAAKKSGGAALARRAPSAPARPRPRRRNAGIAPFVAQSPLVLPNPARRRRARKNPSLNLKKTFELGLVTLGGAGMAAAGETFVSKIENVWARNGARAAMGVASVAFLPKDFGSAAAGAIFMPIAQELLSYFLDGQTSTPAAAAAEAAQTEADLDLLAADLVEMGQSRGLRDW